MKDKNLSQMVIVYFPHIFPQDGSILQQKHLQTSQDPIVGIKSADSFNGF